MSKNTKNITKEEIKVTVDEIIENAGTKAADDKLEKLGGDIFDSMFGSLSFSGPNSIFGMRLAPQKKKEKEGK